jgi:hypothetical protein
MKYEKKTFFKKKQANPSESYKPGLNSQIYNPLNL